MVMDPNDVYDLVKVACIMHNHCIERDPTLNIDGLLAKGHRNDRFTDAEVAARVTPMVDDGLGEGTAPHALIRRSFAEFLARHPVGDEVLDPNDRVPMFVDGVRVEL